MALLTQDAASNPVIELSVVMPCLNEANTIGACIVEALEFFAQHKVVGEIIIGDNGSRDGSQDIAKCLGARVVDVLARGYGTAITCASHAARGRYIIIGDSDGSYDFSSLKPFLDQLRAGKDLVVGNRFRGGVQPGAMPWKNRYIGNPVLSGIGRLFFRCAIGDFHCGLRGVSRRAFRRMELCASGMEFASEMIIKAHLLGMKITEAPTILYPDGRCRPPHLRPWRDGFRHLRFMLLLSPRWLFIYPGILLIVIGTSIMAWLLPGARPIGGIVFDVHTLLYGAAAIHLGFQAVLFGILANRLATVNGLLATRDARLLERCISSVEAGIGIGLALAVCGILGSTLALWIWKENAFGELDSSCTLRIAIPSVLAMAVGTEIGLASAFLDAMRIHCNADRD